MRLAYTIREFITHVVPMSISHFWEEHKAGNLHTVRMGRRHLVTAEEGRRYFNSLRAE